jgi:hypothetical protein
MLEQINEKTEKKTSITVRAMRTWTTYNADVASTCNTRRGPSRFARHMMHTYRGRWDRFCTRANRAFLPVLISRESALRCATFVAVLWCSLSDARSTMTTNGEAARTKRKGERDRRKGTAK